MRLALLASLLAAAAAAAPTEQQQKRGLGFMSEKIRGTNLGGWFVLEPWITPSIFEEAGSPVDERTLCQKLGKEACLSRLRRHWATFYTQSDFQDIKNAGFNTVRIPIGYWAVKPLEGDPYVQGQLKYYDQALDWAASAGLKVWIDLHGAPGSQNGFDNSGWRDHLEWQQGDNIKHTIKAIRGLAERYAKHPAVSAIELLNEPLGPNLDMGKIQQFWMDGWGTVRDSSADVAVVIGDAFASPTNWNGFMTKGWNNVILDTHQYQVFSPGAVGMSVDEHIKTACGLGPTLSKTDKPTVGGEWSGAFTDCTKYLNGIGRGIRYEGTFPDSYWVGSCEGKTSGSISQLSSKEKSDTRRFIEAQMDAFDQSAGWIFWTWKTEGGSPGWELRDLLANGVFPQPLDDRRFPGQCGF